MLKITKKLCTCLLPILLVLVLQCGLYAQEAKYQQTGDNGLVCMEAENYTELVTPIETTWGPVSLPDSFSGTGGMQALPAGENRHKVLEDAQAYAPYLEYPVNFVKADAVYVWMRASHIDGYDDSVWIGMDGIIYGTVPLTYTTAEQVYSNVWHWINHYMGAETTPAKMEIGTAGLHIFQVFMREPSFKFDKILLTSDSTYLPNSESEMGPPETLVSYVESPTASIPKESALYQNYPNPFNPSTTISYSLAKSGFTDLKIYNLLGKEVAVLVNEYQAAGNHQVKWHAEGLASGIYFYKLRSAGFSETRKLLLQK
jgi:hypothetical protein